MMPMTEVVRALAQRLALASQVTMYSMSLLLGVP
jgi:hypothetical protein